MDFERSGKYPKIRKKEISKGLIGSQRTDLFLTFDNPPLFIRKKKRLGAQAMKEVVVDLE